MDPAIVSQLVKKELVGNTIQTVTSKRNSSGEIRLNKKSLHNFLYKSHSFTSESKWVLYEIFKGRTALGTPSFERLNMTRPNIQKKIKQRWTGMNIYNVTAFGNSWEFKTAIIRDEFEIPYFIKQIP
jgi:hypothetical protein